MRTNTTSTVITATTAAPMAPIPAVLHRIVDLSDGWDAGARCRGVDATLFFGPNRFEPKADRLAREARAKALCSTCPVLVSCRDHALDNDELYGVWGGLSETERRALVDGRAGGLRAG